MRTVVVVFTGLLTMVGIFLLAGCAGKFPATTPLGGAEEKIARERLTTFLAATCPTAIDADVTFRWRSTGREISVPGLLQAQEPAQLNFRLRDPLGRPLFIVAADGVHFTLVDIGKGEAWSGDLQSAYWQDFVPAVVAPEDLLGWLSARPSPLDAHIVTVARERENLSLWYQLDYGDGLDHRLQFDPQRALVLRHMMLNGEGEVVLDATYRDYPQHEEQCRWPGEISVTGTKISGAASLRLVRIFSTEPLDETVFQLRVPQHFTLHEVE